MCNMPSYAFMGLCRLLLERILSVQDRDTTRMDGKGRGSGRTSRGGGS